MSMARVESCLSSDFLGAGGRAKEYAKRFKRVFPHEDTNIRNVELVGVGSVGTIRNRIHALTDEGFRVHRIHGPTGGARNDLWDQIKMSGIRPFMPRIQSIAPYFSEQQLLIHTPEAATITSEADFRILRGITVLVENHDFGVGGVAAAVNQARRFTRAGINGKVLLDVVHFIGSPHLDRPTFYDRWKTLLIYMHTMTANLNGFIWAIHWPFGQDAFDSLPRHRFTDSMRDEFVSVLGPSVQWFGFEYQCPGFGLIYLRQKDEKRVRDDMIQEFTAFRKAGLPI